MRASLIYKYISRLPEIVCLILFLWSCSREEAVPVEANFRVEIVNEDYSIPVQVVIINTSTGAEDYQWSFEGGNPSSSLRRNPGTVLYNSSGEYTIKLNVFNRDGFEDSQEITLDLDSPVIVDFKAEIEKDNFSPVTVVLTNSSSGANSFKWSFQGGNPITSTHENPAPVRFDEPGTHTISLEISNGRETYTKDTLITVAPKLVTDFDWEVDFQDRDLQVPVTLTMQNKSISTTGYNWTFEGGMPTSSTKENPVVVFNTPGAHRITLNATNGKETKTVTKTITLAADTNIKVFKDIRLGINTAHNTDTVGSFFSGFTEQVYTKSVVTPEIGNLIDLVFFGLNETFGFNRFYAPDHLGDTTFDAIPNATHTKIINVQEDCGCSASLSIPQYDSMKDDTLLRGITITETIKGLQPFNNSLVPRIVLFETVDGRKGAVKIKRFIADGQNSYIETDIKIQKLPK